MVGRRPAKAQMMLLNGLLIHMFGVGLPSLLFTRAAASGILEQ
jgi:hypothetical protein